MCVQNKDGKRVLITGITGFVITYLVKKLLEHGRQDDAPKLLSNPRKALHELGFKPIKQLRDIIRDQVNRNLNPNPNNRKPCQ
jgi:GDP-D-mannose dehydratase